MPTFPDCFRDRAFEKLWQNYTLTIHLWNSKLYPHGKWWYVKELKNTQSDTRSKSHVPRVSRYATACGSLDGLPVTPKILFVRTVLDESVGINRRRYHTSHLCAGFIFEFLGQLNSFENSSIFDSGPITLNFGGLWVSFSIWRVTVSDVMEEHQICEQFPHD